MESMALNINCCSALRTRSESGIGWRLSFSGGYRFEVAPGVSSQDEDFKTNADGSVDVCFGPKAPEGMEPNWPRTLPGKGWFMILRLYGPLESWFDKTWRPGEIERVK